MAMSKLQKDFQEDLQNFYRDTVYHLPISPLVGENLVPLLDLYVQPQLTVNNKLLGFMCKRNEPDRKSIYLYRDLLGDPGKPYKHIFISAEAGMGKTAFTRKLILTWCQTLSPESAFVDKYGQSDIDTMKQFHFVFYLEMQELEGDVCDVADLLESHLFKRLSRSELYKKPFLDQMFKSYNCLIVLDGVDQWSHPKKCHRNAGEMPHNRYHSECTVLCTTRPWKFSSFKLTSNMIDRGIELSDLTRRGAQQLEYNAIQLLKGIVESESSDIDNSDCRIIDDFDALIASAHLEELRYKPYILLQQLCMWADKRKISTSKSDAVSSIIELTITRGLKKRNKAYQTDRCMQILHIPLCFKDKRMCIEYFHILWKLGKLGFDTMCMQLQDSSRSTDRKYALRFLKSDDLDFLMEVGLISQIKDHNIISEIRLIVSFQDKSIQELLVALYMVTTWESNGQEREHILQLCLELPNVLEMTNILRLVQEMSREIHTDIYNKIILRQPVLDTRFVNTNHRNINVYGGRLIKFTEDEMEQIVQDCTAEKDVIGHGSFGAVFKSNCLQKRYGITVAIKKINVQESQKEQVLNVIKKEMFVSKVRHPFILPTMSVLHELSENRSIFYCISPFCENGDLNMRLHGPSSQQAHSRLDSTHRIRIVLQISLGIQYLHTPVPDVRKAILHKDISSSNIVLDRADNARLIDFGLARELGDYSMTHSHKMCYAHSEVGTKGCNASPKWDYYSFGVVIREVLTGLEPESPDGDLNKLSSSDIQGCWNKKELQLQDIWRKEETFTTLNTIAEKCMTATDILGDFQIKIVSKLKDLFKQTCFTTPIRARDNDDCNRCIQCMTHLGLSSATEKFHSMNCFEKFSICIPCEKGLYVNPVSCYGCNQELQPLIGKNWGALLIAGNDDSSEFSSMFRNDVEKMKKVLTSQSPVIMGIRQELVKEIYPQTPGKPETLLPKLKEAVKELTKADIHTLVFYFSGHGKGSSSGNAFQLGSKEDLLKTEDLQRMLESLTDVNIKKVILFMDRCYPPEIHLKERKERVIDSKKRIVTIQKVQINACETENTAPIDSRLTKYLIEGLKPSSNKNKSDTDKLDDDFITVTDLHRYTEKRYKDDKLQIEPVFYFPGGIKCKDLKIAYKNSEPVIVDFNCGRRIESLEVDLFQHIDGLKSEIIKRFGENKSSCTTEIFRETFRRRDETSNDGQETQGLKCTNIEEVMMAWVLGQRLSVKFISSAD